MKKIILDTNFLLIPLQFRVDIFSEFSRICDFKYKLFIFESSIDELKNIMKNQRGISKKAAQFALKLVKLKNISVIKSKQMDVDSLILSSLNDDTIIATQDKMLKKRLLEKKISVIMLRQKKYLDLAERKLYK